MAKLPLGRAASNVASAGSGLGEPVGTASGGRDTTISFGRYSSLMMFAVQSTGSIEAMLIRLRKPVGAGLRVMVTLCCLRLVMALWRACCKSEKVILEAILVFTFLRAVAKLITATETRMSRRNRTTSISMKV